MDRKAFKQRMQELKSYREQNPGKGYLDWKASKYAEGGEIPPERMEYKGKLYTDKNGRRYTEEQYQDYLKNSTDEISRFDGKPLVRGLKPVVDLEDAANITPVGDAIAIKDTYDAIRNNDWLGAGIAALTVLPFVPNSFGRTLGSRVRKAIPEGVNLDVNPKIAQQKIDAINDLKIQNERRILTEFSNQRNRAIELMYTPEARRRAAKVDQKYGTNYNEVYDKFLNTYENIDEYVNMTPPVRQSDPKTFASVRPRSGEKIYLSTDNIQKPSDMADGLIRHEVGHLVDNYSYPTGINGNPYLRDLAHPKKYESFDRSKYMLNKNTEEDAKRYYDYLREPTEKKSIMNQFEEYLKNHYTPLTYPTTVKEFQNAIMKAPDSQKHMKDLLKLHVKPSILFRDFKNVPLVDNAKRNNNLV